MEILRTFREITMERNHVKITNKIFEYVPKLLDVEKVGVFLVDTADENVMYTITDYGTDEKGIPFITQVAKYPSNVGLTGRAIQSRNVITYDRDKDNQQFKEKDEDKGSSATFLVEVDNFSEAHVVKNALYGPLLDGDGNVTG